MDRELLVNRIISGCLRIKLDGKYLLIKSPTPYQRYCASQLYHELLEEYQGKLIAEEHLVAYLISQGLWSETEEKEMENRFKEIEDFKVSLYEAMFKTKEREKIVKYIKIAKDRINELNSKKNRYSHMSAEGTASLAKIRYLIGVSVYYPDNSPLFNENIDFWKQDLWLLEEVINKYNQERIEEHQYRDIARNDPWRKYWGCRDAASSVFKLDVINLTDEQLSIIAWSLLYDSVYSHPNCPSEDIINDDDRLDGFLIKERRDREKEKGAMGIEKITQNERIRNAQEIFIPVETPEDMKKIMEMNSDAAKSIIKKRDEVIDKRGSVKQHDLPDVRREIQMEYNRMLTEGVHG